MGIQIMLLEHIDLEYFFKIIYGSGGAGPGTYVEQGCRQPFQNEGVARRPRGADWDSKWQLPMDPCTKCHFIWGQHEGGQGFRLGWPLMSRPK